MVHLFGSQNRKGHVAVLVFAVVALVGLEGHIANGDLVQPAVTVLGSPMCRSDISVSPRRHSKTMILPGVQWNVPSPIRLGLHRWNDRRDTHTIGLVRDLFAFARRQTGQAVGLSSARPFSPPYSFGAMRRTRGGGQVKTKEHSSSTKAKKQKKLNLDSPLSAATPFYPVDQIGKMTLGDIGNLFQYAAVSTRHGFDEGQFKEHLSPRVRSAVDAMKKAAAKARGSHVKVGTLGIEEAALPGNLETFNFCAAMRMLTEWRMVRQVPDGYKSFAVSMKMGHNDVIKNIGKIEEAVHHYIADKKQQHGAAEIYSPTLRQLLQYEIDHHQHPRLPRLKENSGAMGLLWVRRQLHFQLAFFENACDECFTSTSEAFQAAYASVYSKYHGIALKKVFSYSLNSAPDIREVYKCMNPSRLQELVDTKGGSLIESEDRPRMFGCAKQAVDLGPNVLTASSKVLPDASQNEDGLEQRISHEMEKDARHHMEFFLSASQPILGGLVALFQELNMDDPKVV